MALLRLETMTELSISTTVSIHLTRGATTPSSPYINSFSANSMKRWKGRGHPLQDYHRHPNHHFHPPPTSHLLSINLHRSKMHLQTGINSLFRRCPRSRSPGHFLVKECFDGSQTMTKIIPKSNEIPLNQTGWPNCLPDHHSRKRIPQ